MCRRDSRKSPARENVLSRANLQALRAPGCWNARSAFVHSLALDAATHRLYVPEQEEDGKPVARIVNYEPVNPAAS
jgi:hypothetical protein